MCLLLHDLNEHMQHVSNNGLEISFHEVKPSVFTQKTNLVSQYCKEIDVKHLNEILGKIANKLFKIPSRLLFMFSCFFVCFYRQKTNFKTKCICLQSLFPWMQISPCNKNPFSLQISKRALSICSISNLRENSCSLTLQLRLGSLKLWKLIRKVNPKLGSNNYTFRMILQFHNVGKIQLN